MSTPFKLKSGNNPIKSKFFGIVPPAIDRLIKKAKKAYKTYKANKPK